MAKRTSKTGDISIDCATCNGRRNGLCERCGPELHSVIAEYKSGDRTIAAGQDLFSPGDPCEAVYDLVEGSVFLYNLSEDGRRQILHFALPEAIVGFHPTAGAVATYGAQALTASVVCAVPRTALGPLFRDHPEIGLRLASLIARDRSLSYDHMASIGRHSARVRVAHLILELFLRFRAQWPGHDINEMYLPLTQEHIGDATGLTGVHVNRVLAALRNERILEFHYRRLKILDPDRLVDIAQVDPQLAQSWTREPRIG